MTISLDSDEVALAGKCHSLADIYQPPARRLIGRACRSYLEDRKVTACELMADPEHITTFNNSAQDMQKAVQLVSAAQARTFTTDLHKRMRVVFQMADKAREKIDEIWKAGVPDIQPGGLGPGLAQVMGALKPDQTSVGLSCLMAKHMHGADGWMERMERAIKLAENETNAAIIEQIDGLIADVFDSPSCQKALFPESMTLGRALIEMAWLHRAGWPPEHVTEPPALVARLNALLAKHPMATTRLAFEQTLQRALNSGVPITRGMGIDALIENCAVHEALTIDGQTIGGPDMTSAIEKRIARQAEPENLVMLLQDKESVVDRLHALIELQKRIVGDGNKRSVNGLMKMEFERREFGAELLKLEDSPTGKLKVVATLYDDIMNSLAPDSLKEKFGIQLEEIQMEFIKKNKIFAKISQSSKGVVDTVKKLADLCRSGVFTKGKNLIYVHSLIKHQVGQSDFKRALMAGVTDEESKQKRLRDLKRLLAEAGIRDEPKAESNAA